MKRRTFLATGAAGLVGSVAGCLDRLGGNDDLAHSAAGPSSTRAPADATALRIIGIYPKAVDRAFVDGEYLVLANTGAGTLDVGGYLLEYPEGTVHELTDLALESGAQVVLFSRIGTDAVYQMSPPVYVRYLGTGGSLLGEAGFVRVRTPAGAIVAEVAYDDFGCDGETGSDDMRCPHA
ncbi:MAG: lamin tail domain-containing protein [Halanaeroarchaeum sp.]